MSFETAWRAGVVIVAGVLCACGCGGSAGPVQGSVPVAPLPPLRPSSPSSWPAACVPAATDGIAWGQSVNGLRVGLPRPRTTLFAYPGFIRYVWVENTGQEPLKLRGVQSAMVGGWRITTKQPGAPDQPVLEWIQIPGVLVPLPPVALAPAQRRLVRLNYRGAHLSFSKSLNLRVRPLPLRVTATYEVGRSEGFWHGRVSTGTIEIELHNEWQSRGIAWGKSVKGMRLGVSSDYQSYGRGQDVDVSFHLRNESKTDQTIAHAEHVGVVNIAMRSVDDGTVWRCVWKGDNSPDAMNLLVSAGRTIKRGIDVGGKDWEFSAVLPISERPQTIASLPPGRYQVSLRHGHYRTAAAKKPIPYWHGSLESGTVQIQIRPDTPEP